MGLDWLGDYLILMHAGAAMKLSAPELVINEDQAQAITRAAANVARHYDIAVLDPKWQDWLVLAGVLGKTYVPIGFALWQRSRGQQLPQQAPQQAPTFDPNQGAIYNGGTDSVIPMPMGTGAVN